MLQSQKHFDNIREKMITLERTLELNAGGGHTDLHSDVEDFMARIMNEAYDYRLHNLNEKKKNFPGLDLGDEINEVGVQVSTDSGSAKVNDMLEKINRYQHYKTYKNNFHLVLGKKLKKYEITVNTTPHYTFDPQTNVIDTADLLRKIQYLPVEKKKIISDFMDLELPGVLNVIQHPQPAPAPSTLIDAEAESKKFGLDLFEHFVMRLSIRNKKLSAPALYQLMEKFYREQKRKDYLPAFNNSLRKSVTPTVVFSYQDAPAGNWRRQTMLSLQENTIVFEHAQYTGGSDVMIASITANFGAMLSLLFFLQQGLLHDFRVQLDVDLSTNGRLAYNFRNGVVFTYDTMNTHLLGGRRLHLTEELVGTDDETLLELLQQFVHGFVGESDPLSSSSPFLTINEERQRAFFTALRGIHSPPLSEL